MKSSAKKSGTSPISGKKLVQARLPFKSVAPITALPTPDTPTSSASGHTVIEAPTEPPRKRKLSTTSDDNGRQAKVNRISEIKENVHHHPMEVVVLISDDECETSDVLDDKTVNKIKVPQSPAVVVLNSKQFSIKTTPRSKSKTPQISQPDVINEDVVALIEPEDVVPTTFAIKLPLSNKRKSSGQKEKSPRASRNKSGINEPETVSPDEKAVSATTENLSPTRSSRNKTSLTEPTLDLLCTDDKSDTLPTEPAIKKPTPVKESNATATSLGRSIKKATPAKEGNTNTTTPGRAIKRATPVNTAILLKDLSEDAGNMNSVNTNEEETLTPKATNRRILVYDAFDVASPSSASKQTAKQVRKLESEQRLQEKLRQKEERDRKAQEERDEKEKHRKREREEKEEQRRRERDEREELKRKEREDREKKRLDEIEAKKRKEDQREEERRRKEELKEEERRKREEEKLAKEEAGKKKNEKEAAAFTKFFVKHSTKSTAATTIDADSNDGEMRQNFMPFRVKEDMKIAPIVRRVFSDSNRANFDTKVLQSEPFEKNHLYIEQLKSGTIKRGRDTKTWPVNDTDVQLIDDELEGAASIIEEPTAKQKYRAKFLKFEENRRPAYYGTWRKKSAAISARKPFSTDKKFFDYEVDSDDEWEEEEPGESLHGSDDEKDKESDDDYDIDNEFFVPHGHLSDEEVMDEADDEDNTPETQKAKLKIVQMEFADEMKKKTQKIKPRLIGLIWQETNGQLPASCASVIGDMLRNRAMIFQGRTIQLVKPVAAQPEASADGEEESKASKRRALIDDDVTDLIRLVHGNVIGKAFLVNEFREFLVQKYEKSTDYRVTPNAAIRAKISELARYQSCPDAGDLYGRFCWYVPLEVREKCNCAAVTIPNTWTYVLEKTRTRVAATADVRSEKKIKPVPEPAGEGQTPGAAALDGGETKAKSTAKFNISNFTKVLSEDDRKRQFSSVTADKEDCASSPSATLTVRSTCTPPFTKPAATKKRVSLLMSVPRGQQIPTTAKNELISKFLDSSSATASPSPSSTSTASNGLPPTESIELE